MRITLTEGPRNTFRIRDEQGNHHLIQFDGDCTGTAIRFGWQPCPCGKTDGTIDCLHRTADEMIAEARKYLEEHFGDSTDDCGYFG